MKGRAADNGIEALDRSTCVRRLLARAPGTGRYALNEHHPDARFCVVSIAAAGTC